MTPPEEVMAELARRVEAVMAAVTAHCAYIGEECVREARSNHLYLNQTGNLCSSIGYAVVADGRVVAGGGFRVVGQGAGGAARGRELLARLADEHAQPGHVALIIVAGMDYTSYVEDMHLNVFDSAATLMRSRVDGMIRKHFTTR